MLINFLSSKSKPNNKLKLQVGCRLYIKVNFVNEISKSRTKGIQSKRKIDMPYSGSQLEIYGKLQRLQFQYS